MCLGCRARRPVAELRRLAVVDGEVVLDASGGRGAWVCRDDRSCSEVALAPGRLERALRVAVTAEARARLRQGLLGDPGQGRSL